MSSELLLPLPSEACFLSMIGMSSELLLPLPSEASFLSMIDTSVLSTSSILTLADCTTRVPGTMPTVPRK